MIRLALADAYWRHQRHETKETSRKKKDDTEVGDQLKAVKRKYKEDGCVLCCPGTPFHGEFSLRLC